MTMHDFDQIVEQFNRELGLNIMAHRKFPLSSKDGIERDIYFKLKKDYADDRNRFDQSLLSLKSVTNAFYKNWLYKHPLADQDTDTLPSTTLAGHAPLGGPDLSTAERADLYERLGEIVHADQPPARTPRPSSPCPKKRESDERDGDRTKRSRHVSERPLSPEKPSLVTRMKSQCPDLSMSSRFRDNASASISRNSFHSTTFSIPQETERTSFSSQDTTINDRKPIDSQEFPISSTDEQALEESFFMLEGDSSQDIDHIPVSRSFNLGSRFEGIWPALPENGLNHVELSVLWEITRVALHCGIDLRTFDGIESLDLDAGSEEDQKTPRYADQKSFYATLRQHPLFSAKSIPPPSSTDAWETSLGIETARKPHHVVVFKAELVQDQKGEKAFQVKLNPLEQNPGHRLDRRFGFDRFLELVVPAQDSDSEQAEVAAWLSGEHAFLGRRWRSFFIKSTKRKIRERKGGETIEKLAYFHVVYMFAVDGNSFHSSENPDKAPPPLEGVSAGRASIKCSIRGLLGWALNLSDSRNVGQPAPKLFSRLALSLSRCIAGKVLEKHQIINEPEDVCNLSKDGKKVVMNDGLGTMSRSLARSLAKVLGLTDTPSAFQGRLGSAKGVWIIDVTEDLSERDIWIKTFPSQRKWECDFEDQEHRTFGIKGWPNSSSLKPTNLNLQFIPVLEHGAIDRHRMRHSMEQRLRLCLEQETTAEKEALGDPRRLLQLVYKAGSGSTLTYEGGLPRSDEDRAFVMLASGFTPKNRYLSDLLWKLRQAKTDELRKRMKIRIPCSAYLYMVVDMWEILEPNEVHVSFSNKFSAEGGDSLGVPGFSDTMLDEVDVLVGRSPAHLPSDIQKVRAVSHSKLRKLKDVIVFSAKGTRPLADYLSGGDYDGDMAWVCWDREIVSNFQETKQEPPECNFVAEGWLQKDRTTFQDLLRQHKDNTAYDEFLYKGLSFSMQQDMLGICTKEKERVSYKLGVGNPVTIRLSVLLGDLVDSAKAGVTFTRDSWKQFKGTLALPMIEQPEYDKDKASDTWYKDVKFRRREPHVLDYLKFLIAERIIETTLTEFNQALRPVTSPPLPYDEDLTVLSHEFSTWANSSRSGKPVLKALEHDLHLLKQLWDEGVVSCDVNFDDNVQLVHEKFMAIQPQGRITSSRTINCLNDAWMRYTSESRLLDKPGDLDWSGQYSRWTLLKASMLFKHLYAKNEPLCWHIAGRQLLHLKASVVSPKSKDTIPMLVVPEIFRVLRPDKRAIQRLVANQGTGEDSLLALEQVNDFDEEGTVIDDA